MGNVSFQIISQELVIASIFFSTEYHPSFAQYPTIDSEKCAVYKTENYVCI